MIELPGHPYFIACQFHPEFKSRPLEPHPLFVKFVEAAVVYRRRTARTPATGAAGAPSESSAAPPA
jgi:CTP synthase